MKKLFCILLTIAMLLSLCACGKDTAKDDDDNDNIRGTITTDPTETTAPGNQQPDNTPEFSLGKTSGGTYTNDFLGLTFNLPIGWTFYTDEQILAANNLAFSYTDEQIQERLKNAPIIYDMFATDPTTNSSVNVNMEKLTALQVIGLDIKKSFESQFSTITTTLENMGCTDIIIQQQKVTVDNVEYDGIVLTAKINNIPLYQAAFAFKRGNYLACVTVCTMQTDTRASLLNAFSFT